MVTVRGLSYHYGPEVALDDVSFEVEPNTTCAILGPSGCGKTTLVYCIAGLLVPHGGEVVVGGRRVSGHRSNTGLVFQDGGLLPWKTIADNVSLGLIARNKDPSDRPDARTADRTAGGRRKSRIARDDRNRRVAAMLAELGIAEQARKFPDQLSGGQRQRAALARTLVLEPDLLLLDEASSSLDTITREQIQDLLLDLHVRSKTTMIFVTHSIEEAVFLGARIVVMSPGRVAAVVANAAFGLENARSSSGFFETCVRVRAIMEGQAGS